MKKLTVKKSIVTKAAKPSGIYPTMGPCMTVPPMCK
jgi:hypothetical protein